MGINTSLVVADSKKLLVDFSQYHQTDSEMDDKNPGALVLQSPIGRKEKQNLEKSDTCHASSVKQTAKENGKFRRGKISVRINILL